MGNRFAQAALVAFLAITVFGWVSVLGSRYAVTLLAGSTLVTLAAAGIWYGMRHAEDLHAWLRHRFGGGDNGTFHAFAGVRLHVDDDGRHLWVKAAGVQRVLGLKEDDLVTASRVPGQWRRADDGALWLRVDGLVQTLSTMPGRNELRLQRFRRYLERDLLFPARERQRRG